ncbi:LamG-like jellyroll fold domain-containing protein, partial [Geodermatophilus marinus]|uniref:LamG-like jellyroll fold domain-containing protein n=1 Tax=Geodermatophilus sp. LHW52908 TaxID=2303986 RepID=UPI000E3E1E97
MSVVSTAWGKTLLAGLVSLMLGVGAVALPAPAVADTAPVNPADPATPATVTADPLPTAQINGVAWAQVVVGNTVYVAGRFTRVRPAGAAPGTQETVRNNLLAYDIRTGELITSFAPDLNAQALAITASPDGSRIYVGGDFTQADGQTRYNLAAYDTATGRLVSDFRPAFNSQVAALAATNDRVFAGGWFTAVGGTARRNLAAISANGTLLPWAPVPGPGNTTAPATSVSALVVTGNGNQVVAGGRFGTLNGVAAVGVGALDATSGATKPFAVNQVVTNQGQNAAVNSLSTDGTSVYGTAYNYFGPGNLEGSFKATANGGQVEWINDCRGDTYSSFPSNGVLYMATHAHDCSTIGGFPEQNPRVNLFGTAVSLAATGTVGNRSAELTGKPAPSLLPWFPTFYSGTYTGQFQAGWSVTGNSQYVVYGGEFPGVNGSEQQGLVRFAVSSLAPNRVGPRATGTFGPSVSTVPGAVRITWKAVHDRDNEHLTYRVYRDESNSAPVCEVTRPSRWWDLPTYGCADTGASAGSHRWLVVASDAAGNELASSWVTATVGAANSGPSGTYGDLVAADGASAHWSLGELSGSTAYDRVGTRDMTMNSGVTRNQAGALAGDGGTAFSFNGTSTGFLATTAAATSPQVFSVEAWVQTTSRTGGKIVGYGNRATGTSTSYDRHVFMDAAGRLHFGVWNGAQQRVGTTATYNDGRWHHVVASLSHRGMELYVDGVLAGTRPQVTAANPYSGFWRVGGDRGWQSAAEFFAGQIDEVAVYPTALSAQQVAGHNTTGRTGQVPNTAPSAVFSAAVADLAVAVDGSGSADADGSVASYAWEFGDGGTGTGVTASHGYAAAGSYTVRLTVTDDDGATASTSRVVTVTAPAAEPEPQPEPQPGDGALAVDAFDREVVSGWGTADRGGAWTVGGSGSTSVTGGAGQLSAEARRNASALLAGVSSLDAAVQAELVVPELATGGGTYVSVATRRGGTSDYRLLLRYRGDGVVEVMLARHVNGVETILTGTALSGGYSPGQSVTVRFETEGTGTTTLRAKAWASGAPEPAAWLVTGTDSTAALQREGAVFLYEYVSGSATRASTVRVDDLWVGAAGTAPGEPTGTPVDPAPVNQAPSASFTAVPTELSAAFDGSGSADADGSVASY